MKKKRYTKEQISKAIKEHEAGPKTDGICLRLGISSVTFYNWRNHYNHVRPHRSLDYMTPVASAASAA